MLIAALVLAGLAAVVHVYIFWIEAPAFLTVGRKVFGVSAEHAGVMAPWAWNQGFYNAFLAIGTVVGIVLQGSNRDAGLALVTFCTASMVAAALVLASSDRTKLRGALVQGVLPALALLCLLLWAL